VSARILGLPPVAILPNVHMLTCNSVCEESMTSAPSAAGIIQLRVAPEPAGGQGTASVRSSAAGMEEDGDGWQRLRFQKMDVHDHGTAGDRS